MDRWNAPQWVNFNATFTDDSSDYFNYEHKELERHYSNGMPVNNNKNVKRCLKEFHEKKLMEISPREKLQEGTVLADNVEEDNANGNTTKAPPKASSLLKKVKKTFGESVREHTTRTKTKEEKSKKSHFHVRPAPSFDPAKKTTTVLKPKVNNPNQKNPVVRTKTFQERNEVAIKKKKELMDRIVEQENQVRIFHAKPAPTFKPVFVRGNFTENLRARNGNKRTQEVLSMARQKGVHKHKEQT